MKRKTPASKTLKLTIPVIVRSFAGDEWEFVYPASIDNETTYNQYWEGVTCMDNDPPRAEGILKQLILEHPYYIDAYVYLSFVYKNQNKSFESFLVAEKAYQLGKSCFPDEFDVTKGILSWGLLENRPFLRSCQTLGLLLQEKGEILKAIELFQENLRLNPDDNQGIRYLLLECYFAIQDLANCRKLIRKYQYENSIEFLYGKVILFVLSGEFDKADKALGVAKGQNSHVIGEIIKVRRSKAIAFEDQFTLRSPQEAYNYWQRNIEILSEKAVMEYFRGKK